MRQDLSLLIAQVRSELHRVGEGWRTPRTLDFCEKVTGYRDAHYLTESQLRQLFVKLQQLPSATAPREIRAGARVRIGMKHGLVDSWDSDIDAWVVRVEGRLEPFITEELELAS